MKAAVTFKRPWNPRPQKLSNSVTLLVSCAELVDVVERETCRVSCVCVSVELQCV